MESCPRCSSKDFIRDGLVKGRQRYKCKQCIYHYSVVHKAGISPELKALALKLYLEGLGFRSIGRVLGVSNVSVLNWIREYGQKAKAITQQNHAVKSAQLDEVRTYIGSKKSNLAMVSHRCSCQRVDGFYHRRPYNKYRATTVERYCPSFKGSYYYSNRPLGGLL